MLDALDPKRRVQISAALVALVAAMAALKIWGPEPIREGSNWDEWATADGWLETSADGMDALCLLGPTEVRCVTWEDERAAWATGPNPRSLSSTSTTVCWLDDDGGHCRPITAEAAEDGFQGDYPNASEVVALWDSACILEATGSTCFGPTYKAASLAGATGVIGQDGIACSVHPEGSRCWGVWDEFGDDHWYLKTLESVQLQGVASTPSVTCVLLPMRTVECSDMDGRGSKRTFGMGIRELLPVRLMHEVCVVRNDGTECRLLDELDQVANTYPASDDIALSGTAGCSITGTTASCRGDATRLLAPKWEGSTLGDTRE